MAAPPPQNFPYDYLFKVLIIGDASVGKVRPCLFYILCCSAGIADCFDYERSRLIKLSAASRFTASIYV